MTLVFVHHAVTTVVHDSECLLVGVGVLDDPLLYFVEYLLCLFCVEVGFLDDFHVFVEAVLLDVTTEYFHVVLDSEEIEEALYFRVAISVFYCPADGRIVDVTDD